MARYPNVSVIDLREVLDTIQSIVDNVTLGITVVGGLVLFSGMLILIGAVSMTKFQRVYEAAILKTLGASSRLIATMLLLEYGVLGAIAGTVGAARRHRAELGGRPLRARHDRGTPVPMVTRRRHRRDLAVRRRHRRACQLRRAPAQAARDAPGRIEPGKLARAKIGVCPGQHQPVLGARSQMDLETFAHATCCRSAASCSEAAPRSRSSGRWRTTRAARATWPIRRAATTKSTSSSN